MPFTDAVSNFSGRDSRASNVSGVTGASQSRSRAPPANDMFSNAGVLSMLKTTTDTGDIGSMSFNNRRLPTMPRPTRQRRGHVSGLSASSHQYPGAHHRYAPSQTSRVSDNSTSFVRRGSLTSMQSMPPSLPTSQMGREPIQPPAPIHDRTRDRRSYSLTSAQVSQLPRLRSASSLRSAGHESRHGPRLHPGHIPPMGENRPPYVYPTRLKRPGYRSPSPALSEVSAQGLPLPLPQQGRRGPPPMVRPQPQTCYSDYGSGYPGEAQHLNVRPPPRTMNVSPILGYEPAYYASRQVPMRSGPGVPNPAMVHPGMPPMHPQQAGRQQYYGPQYGPPRPIHPQYAQMQYPAHRAQPPMANGNPMAHHMFHNAARMARHLPPRTDTPMTDLGPPSSDPPSSGTAPSVSGPPTPKDQSSTGHILVAVDPLFIDPSLTDLPDSSSEPVLNAKYFEYADGIDRSMDDSEMEVPHPSVPQTGFVQRVKAMLESKAAVEAAATREAEREVRHQHQAILSYQLEESPSQYHELAAIQTPRFTIIEEFDAPVELPASPVKIAELSNTPPQGKHRLTRELVKAELTASSFVDDSITQNDSLDAKVEHFRTVSQASSAAIHDVSPAPPSVNLDSPEADRRKPSFESAATASPEPTAISGIDYALRFAVQVDTTNITDETQSRDPFLLDADTITMQHQRSTEQLIAPRQRPVRTKPPAHQGSSDNAGPVSPMHPGEDVTRCSAVSPLHTQTLGIDETMGIAVSSDIESMSDPDQSMLESSTIDTQPPPTPRTPRTYSKSVQLPPSAIKESTPGSNRYSLPPDLSTMADTTMNTNSDMITDVAVRFSFPNTTITIGKPQIVTIPPSSSPEKPESPPAENEKSLGPKSAHRHSVTFADHVVMPLNVRKPDPRREASMPSQSALSKGKTVVHRMPTLEDISDASRTSRESTTELRFPNSGLNGRFGSTHLPGLKEESVDDMSIHEQKRSSNAADAVQFPLPARIAAVKAMQERRLQESAEKARARRAARHQNRPLAETRDLPSLNFSRTDLIEKLNQALEVRPSKSMDIVRRRDFSAIYCPSPQRPLSTEPLRERYESFFSKPEDFSSFFAAQIAAENPDEVAAAEVVPTVEVQESTKLEDVHEEGSRPLSPADFLIVATQVSRLSIPSVTGLSERLSNLLPSLRNLHLDSVLADDGEVAQTIEDINRLGHEGEGTRPNTLLSAHLSAGFRTLAERAEEIVLNGTHDSVKPRSKLLLTDKELPPLPLSTSPVDGKPSYLSGSVSAPTDLSKELTRPVSALARHKSPGSEEEVRQLLPPEMNPIARGSKRSLLSSGTSSRPWNQDENYPWSGTNLPMDLTVPSKAHIRSSTVPGDFGLRGSLSLDLTTTAEPGDTTRGIDIGSITSHSHLSRSASITTEQATGISTQHHTRTKSKRSMIGSISKKIGLGHCATTAGTDELKTRSVASPALKSDTSLQPHMPGERYPSTSLTPPVAFNLDEVRSFFSDNSSEKQRNASFRKRLTGFKGKGKHVRLDVPRGHSSMDGAETGYDTGSITAEGRAGASSAAYTYDGIGMGKAEFRIKRFGVKFRHFLAKGGELIRSLSARGKGGRGEKVRDDWLSDSLYSGV